MSRSLTFELPDEVYKTLEQMAARSGRPLRQLALEWLARYAPKADPGLSEQELAAAWVRLRRHAGAVNSSDRCAADNERIDADMARAYGEAHEPARRLL